jgi:hypothetical protein
MKVKPNKPASGRRFKQKAQTLGRSSLTGTRVLRPVTKGGTISLDQVRSAVRALSAAADK